MKGPGTVEEQNEFCSRGDIELQNEGAPGFVALTLSVGRREQRNPSSSHTLCEHSQATLSLSKPQSPCVNSEHPSWLCCYDKSQFVIHR